MIPLMKRNVQLLETLSFRYKHVFQQSMSEWGNVHEYFEWLHLHMLITLLRPALRGCYR